VVVYIRVGLYTNITPGTLAPPVALVTGIMLRLVCVPLYIQYQFISETLCATHYNGYCYVGDVR